MTAGFLWRFAEGKTDPVPLTSREMQEEREANEFAMCLLMPESLVRPWCDEHPKFSLAEFAKAFAVPLAAATLRLADLGIPFDVGE